MIGQIPLVLVADDEDEIRELITFWLWRSGYDVIAVADGEEALDAAAAFDLDAAVLDAALPGLDALEGVRRLRSQGAARLPVILTVACAGDLDAAGLADDWIPKPVDPYELVARLQAVLGRS